MTVTSINSLNPANDPDSMVAFLPNVRRNTMERMPSTEDQRYFASIFKKIHHTLFLTKFPVSEKISIFLGQDFFISITGFL